MLNETAGELMKRECTIRYGSTPDHLEGGPLFDVSWQMTPDAFLFRGIGEHYFHYRRGGGITIQRGPGADLSAEPLWLNGSVYAAVASMNGLMPIHASAVAMGRQVYAFTGKAGAGKSTLIAALGRRGIPMFCDDTLVLDLASPNAITCLPGHKRLKLTLSAIQLAGATPQEPVALSLDKWYCLPPGGEVREALPLGQLIFLDEGPDPQILGMSGFERFQRLQDDHYTARMYEFARDFDRSARFWHFACLADRISTRSFVRPKDAARFEEGVSTIVDYLTADAQSRDAGSRTEAC